MNKQYPFLSTSQQDGYVLLQLLLENRWHLQESSFQKQQFQSAIPADYVVNNVAVGQVCSDTSTTCIVTTAVKPINVMNVNARTLTEEILRDIRGRHIKAFINMCVRCAIVASLISVVLKDISSHMVEILSSLVCYA